MGMLQSKLVKLPLITIIAPESGIVNRQIGVKIPKFLVVTGPRHTGHLAQRMHNGHFRQYSPPKPAKTSNFQPIFGLREIFAQHALQWGCYRVN